jgi:allantoin racemase
MAPPRRILVVNPNTSEAVTRAYLDVARAVAPPGVAFDGVTGRFGARIVSTGAENLIAGHAALELVADNLPGHDAVILAISFDTGLAALRDLLPVPVVGITEAALAAARTGDRRVGVVIFGEVSRPLYEQVIAGYGGAVIGYEAVGIGSPGDYLDPTRNDAAVAQAVGRLAARGAEAAVICGAAIVGIAARLQACASVPLFDGSEAVAMCMAAQPTPPPAHPPIAGSTGLSPALAALLAGSRA